jgi:hypothetical protein
MMHLKRVMEGRVHGLSLSNPHSRKKKVVCSELDEKSLRKKKKSKQPVEQKAQAPHPSFICTQLNREDGFLSVACIQTSSSDAHVHAPSMAIV